jgi:Carbohydrate binding module (family 6)
VAYHDDTSENSGGEYRPTRVDVESTADGGVGYNVGWMHAGEWLQYTVAVQDAGTYAVAARVASGRVGARFHIEVDGVDNTGPISVADTGGWQSWVTMTHGSVALTAGQHRLRVVVEADGMNLNFISLDAIASGGSTPFGGVAAAVPGVIMAAAFDDGGEGVAYHDTTPGNAGGEYRATDVDIQSTGDSSGEYNVGWMKAGEWLSYTVNIASAGTYNATFRVAAPDVGATFHLEVQGADITGPLQIPNTGDYQAWQNVTKVVTLPAGVARIQFVVDAPGVVVGNLRSITFTAASAPPPPPTPTVPTIPGVVNAADFDNDGEGVSWHDTSPANNGGVYRSTSVDIEPSSEGGYDVGWIAPGEWLNYTVNVSAAATYVVSLRVASPSGGGSLHVGFNTPSSVWQTMSVPSTGDWQEWTTVSIPVTLAAGQQQITLFFDTGGFNVSRITIAK